jgi:hypothetical protein
MVIAGVAEKAGPRISHLVYLDAFLPENGKAVKDYAQLKPTRADVWRIALVGPPSAYGVTNERDVAWMTPRLGDQPQKTFTQPIQLFEEKNRSLAKTFIQCTKAPLFGRPRAGRGDRASAIENCSRWATTP